MVSCIKEKDVPLQEIAKTTTGPMVFAYVWWILTEARKRGLKRLYFLARDGYVLKKIAERFCSKFNLDIECRYLYCSRVSLRTPSYHLIGDEAYELLFLGGYHVTPNILLKRAGLYAEEVSQVYRDIEFPEKNADFELSKVELHRLKERLLACERYCTFVHYKSKQAYPSAMGYLRQQGLLEENTIAIVDSGWTGSMQRSLRQLLESAGCKTSLIGFYFGMFVQPKSHEDGEYLTWYFDNFSEKIKKIKFSNNLFECMLSAPHGMTVEYKEEKGEFIPVLKEPPASNILKLINLQLTGILEYADETIHQVSFEDFNKDKFIQSTYRSITRLMVYPTREEAEIYGSFAFCDDVTEGYHMSLANANQLKMLKSYMILPRIYRKLFCKNPRLETRELFWPYGTIAFLPGMKQKWLRLNIYIWEWLRYTIVN